MSISMRLTCGDELLSPASQALLIFPLVSPGSAAPRQGLYSTACWRRLEKLVTRLMKSVEWQRVQPDQERSEFPMTG